MPNFFKQLSARFFVFIVCLLFLLLSLWGLGDRMLWGSEDRWAEISRLMLLNRDFFHPLINGYVYFDKPLLTYWFIAFFSLAWGAVTEFSARLPSVLFGLSALALTFAIARERFGERVALYSGLIFASSYAVLFWSRLANADIANMAVVLCAVWWFLRHQDRYSFSAYLGFYMLCALGAHLKGLVNLPTTLLSVLPLLFAEKRWLRHCNAKNLLACLLGMGLYLAPFLFAKYLPLPSDYQSSSRELSGLGGAFRENFVRYFNPFDHRDPIYSYFYNLPKAILPWFLFLFAALATAVRDYGKNTVTKRWPLQVFVLLFVFFSLSGSRRWYYIMPVLPFGALLIGLYLDAKRPILLRLVSHITAAMVFIFWLAVLLSPYLLAKTALSMPHNYLHKVLVLCAISAIPALIYLIRCEWFSALGPQPFFYMLSLSTLLTVGGSLSVVVNSFDVFRTDKRLALHVKAQKRRGVCTYFFNNNSAVMSFYIGDKKAIPVLSDIKKICARKPSILIASSKDLPLLEQKLKIGRRSYEILREKTSSTMLKPAIVALKVRPAVP